MKIFEKGELSLLWPFYLDIMLKSMFYIWILFYVIYFNQIGLSFFQIATLFAMFSFLGIIFEIPTGAIADIFGRKFSVVLGYVLVGFTFIFIGLFENYYILLGLFALLGISATLTSGADQALVIEYLNKNKRKDLVQDFYIKEPSIGSLGGIFNGIIGALLVKYFGLGIIWWSTGFSSLIGTLFIFLFVNEGFARKKVKIRKQLKETWNYSKFSINYASRHPVLSFMIIAGFFTVISFTFGDMLAWQPLLISLGFEVHWIGYLVSIGALIAMVIPFLSKSLSKIIKSDKNYLTLMLLFLFFISFLIIFVNSWYTAALIFLLGVIPCELLYPIRQKFFQSNVPGKYRASITSFRTMVIGIGAVIGTLIAGYLIDLIGPKMTIFISAFLLIPAMLFYYFIKEIKRLK